MDTQQISERARVFYSRLDEHIRRGRRYVREGRFIESPEWGFEISAIIDTAAKQHEYGLYRENSSIPQIHLIGYELASLDKTVSFLEALAWKGIFEECTLFVEGYDNSASMLSRAKPVTNAKLNAIFNNYKLKPQGRDSFVLRERQYATLDEIADLRERSPRQLRTIKKKVKVAMGGIVARQQDYFLPAFAEEERPVIFLANTIHALSFGFCIPQMMQQKVKYAVWVPRN
ncbi:MAG: hypothetical protein Q8R47_02690 [Nanoarchaeota archaeon]|nr:hypothetical protein [Nanoarchaeota archaeon]